MRERSGRATWPGPPRTAWRVEVAQRLPLADLASVHQRSDAGRLHGKVVLVPPTD